MAVFENGIGAAAHVAHNFLGNLCHQVQDTASVIVIAASLQLGKEGCLSVPERKGHVPLQFK